MVFFHPPAAWPDDPNPPKDDPPCEPLLDPPLKKCEPEPQKCEPPPDVDCVVE
jgi:hypothetical protein